MRSARDIRLGDLATICRGFPTHRAVPEGDIRVMSVAALRTATPPRHFADRVDVAEEDLARAGDVLVAIEGGTVGEALVLSEEIDEFLPSQQVATLRVHDWTQVDPWYLGAWLTAEPGSEQLRRLARGAGIQRIPVKDLASLIVRVPPLAEQQEIATRLRAFETAIQSHRAVTLCLEHLRDHDLLVTFAELEVPAQQGSKAHGRGANP